MGKLLLYLSLLSLLILIAGSILAPNSSVMWLATTAMSYNIVRGVVAVGIVSLIFTNPPRNMLLRLITGVMAFGLMLSALYLTYEGTLKVLDGLSFVAAGLSMGISALEVGYNPMPLYKKIITNQKAEAKS